MTARLSKRFYDTFGDEIANDLVEWFNQVDATYRQELREQNDFNWGRVEARIGQGEARMEARISQAESRMESRLVEMETRLRSEFHQGTHRPAGRHGRRPRTPAVRPAQVDVPLLVRHRPDGARPPVGGSAAR
ncbi:MAG: hypothetical protein IPG75_17140 [Gemmatimonadetes bacterium]|nr:hypothetical protein [Gemmatimonadota bacterium]